MHSATASGPNSVNAGLHLVTLRSNQACRTKDLPKWSVDVCQWSTPNPFQKENVKGPKKINGCWTYTTVWSFPDKHDKIFPLTGCHYIHSFCPVCTHLLCRPKAKDEMQLLKRVFCLSHQKASLDNVVVFMWLCKVVIKFRTFEEDHPANTIWGWTCNQMFRTTRNAPLKWWQMVKSRVGMHTRYSVSHLRHKTWSKKDRSIRKQISSYRKLQIVAGSYKQLQLP